MAVNHTGSRFLSCDADLRVICSCYLSSYEATRAASFISVTLSKPVHPHQKHTCKGGLDALLVEVAGIEPASRILQVTPNYGNHYIAAVGVF